MQTSKRINIRKAKPCNCESSFRENWNFEVGDELLDLKISQNQKPNHSSASLQIQGESMKSKSSDCSRQGHYGIQQRDRMEIQQAVARSYASKQ